MAPSKKLAGNSLMVTLKIAPNRLRDALPTERAVSQESPLEGSGRDDSTSSKHSEPSPAPSATTPAAPSNGDNASDSSPATPGSTTPAPTSAMGPPTDTKKKGLKRTSSATNGDTKSRVKPGPKKRPRFDDGLLDPTATGRGIGGHRLGPKANQGAINAGLRALDRSGTPCRKWQKGTFKFKTFTGVMWEIPRWSAPPKRQLETTPDDSTAVSTNSSTKENKEELPQKSEVNSTTGADVEIKIEPPIIGVSSPAPLAVTAAS